MSQNFSFDDEESSNNDYLGSFCHKISPKINEDFSITNCKEIKKKINEIIFGETFENEFNEIFTKQINDITIYNKEIPRPLIQDKIFKDIKPLQDKHIIIKNEKSKEKYFPFSPGIGIKNCLEKLGYTVNYTSPYEISLKSNDDEENIYNTNKFQIIDYSKDEKGKIKRNKKKRKYKPDDIRKKIKSRFHKVIKNIININLRKAGSKKLFDFFPQNFIANITIKLNNIALNYTYNDLIKIDIASTILKQNKSDIDLAKYKRNLDVLNYLDHNPKISNVSFFSKIRHMKYREILKAYFLSKEYEQSIIDLHNKRENIKYIEQYVNKSMNYINFFSLKKSYEKNASDNSEQNNFTNTTGEENNDDEDE